MYKYFFKSQNLFLTTGPLRLQIKEGQTSSWPFSHSFNCEVGTHSERGIVLGPQLRLRQSAPVPTACSPVWGTDLGPAVTT